MTTTDMYYSVVADHDQLPPLTITAAELLRVEEALLGTKEEPRIVSAGSRLESEWADTLGLFYRERLVHVLSNNVLLVRFAYCYEVDLDRIAGERALLGWTRHLAGKTWMTTHYLAKFIDAVCAVEVSDCTYNEAIIWLIYLYSENPPRRRRSLPANTGYSSI
jgi:hypothetical protein